MRFLRCRRAVLWLCPRWVECESPTIERRTANGTLTTRQKLSELGKMATRAGHLPGKHGGKWQKAPCFPWFPSSFLSNLSCLSERVGLLGKNDADWQKKTGRCYLIAGSRFLFSQVALAKKKMYQKTCCDYMIVSGARESDSSALANERPRFVTCCKHVAWKNETFGRFFMS